MQMQDKNHADVKKILLALASHLKVKGIRGLAEALGEKESKLYAWISRGIIADTGSILSRCPEVRKEWLESGEGEMLRAPDFPHGLMKFRKFADAIISQGGGQDLAREGPWLCDEQRRLIDAWNAADPVSRKNALMILETSAKESRANGTGGSDCAGQKSA